MPLVTICKNRYEIDDRHVVDACQLQDLKILDSEQIANAVSDCFAEPVDFPPINQAVLPEDSVAIVVAPDTPHGLDVATAMYEQLLKNGNDPEKVTIVGVDLAFPNPDSDTSDAKTSRPRIEKHDPNNEDCSAYLMADISGRPLYINRTLFDADVVVPVGPSDGQSAYNFTCPVFCNKETQKILAKMKAKEFGGTIRAMDSNLGAYWQVRVIVAPGGEINSVLAGLNEPVWERANDIATEIWDVKIREPAELVIATLEAKKSQTWKNVRLAIINADRIAAESAPLAICTTLRRPPAAHWPAKNSKRSSQESEIADIFHRRHIYLASKLDQETTEQIGLGFLKDSNALQKLVDQSETCLLLRDAHRVGFKKIVPVETTELETIEQETTEKETIQQESNSE